MIPLNHDLLSVPRIGPNDTGCARLYAGTLMRIPTIELAFAATAAQAKQFLTGVTARRRMSKSADAIMIGAGIGVAVT